MTTIGWIGTGLLGVLTTTNGGFVRDEVSGVPLFEVPLKTWKTLLEMFVARALAVVRFPGVSGLVRAAGVEATVTEPVRAIA